MTTKQQLSAIREMVRDLGEVTKWEDNFKTYEMRTVMLLSLDLMGNDVYTFVEIDHYGQLNVGGYDGNEGWAMDAKELDDDTINRVYEAMLDYGTMRCYPYTSLSIDERINLKHHFKGSKWHQELNSCPIMSQEGLDNAIKFANTWNWYWTC